MHSKVSFPEPVHSRGLILRATDPHPNNLKASSQTPSSENPECQDRLIIKIEGYSSREARFSVTMAV